MVTLFLSKPPRGSLPVFSAQSFASNCQLLFLNQGKGVIFSTTECAGLEDRSAAACLRSAQHTTDQATTPSLKLNMDTSNC